MATKERPEQQGDFTEPVLAGAQDLAPVESPEPLAPQGITEEEAQEIQNRATELVKQLGGANGSQELELFDNMSNLGIQAQRNAGSELELLRGRVGEMITSDGTGAQIARDLLDVRVALNEINPQELAKRNVWNWALQQRALGLWARPALAESSVEA